MKSNGYYFSPWSLMIQHLLFWNEHYRLCHFCYKAPHFTSSSGQFHKFRRQITLQEQQKMLNFKNFKVFGEILFPKSKRVLKIINFSPITILTDLNISKVIFQNWELFSWRWVSVRQNPLNLFKYVQHRKRKPGVSQCLSYSLYENPKLLFPFFIMCYFNFFP